ncbi:MAG: hypothetical protein IMZ53_12745 [Thermoplasmata archaeon]|nr:hypothetical protein [Thermoplasmata archaeon]
MKIHIKHGVIFKENNSIIEANAADNIAIANGLVFAEEFVKEYDGQILELNEDLKIVSIGRIPSSMQNGDTIKFGSIQLDIPEQVRIEALRILEKKFIKGDQVRYVPEIAKKNHQHSACQTGIVVSTQLDGDIVYVRYFRGQYLQATPEATDRDELIFWGEGV